MQDAKLTLTPTLSRMRPFDRLRTIGCFDKLSTNGGWLTWGVPKSLGAEDAVAGVA